MINFGQSLHGFQIFILLIICENHFRKCLNSHTVEPLLTGHPDERPPPLERPLDNVNLNINVLISTLNERPPLLKDHFLVQKRWPHKRGSTVQAFVSLTSDIISSQCLLVALVLLIKLSYVMRCNNQPKFIFLYY